MSRFNLATGWTMLAALLASQHVVATGVAAILAPDSVGAITGIHVNLKGAAPDEQARLERYVSDVVGKPASHAVLADLRLRIQALRRYADADCSVHASSGGTTVSCAVERARVLRDIRIVTAGMLPIGVRSGLPLAILESDLRKRLFLRAGDPIDDEDALGRGDVARQRVRIEDFLEREGFYGAQVRITALRTGDEGFVDLLVDVRGGSFVKVRNVNIRRWGPFSQRELHETFGAMCWNGDGLLEGVVLGNLTSCFNRRRLDAATTSLERRLADLGYLEARVRTRAHFVNARSRTRSGGDDCAWTQDEVRAFTKQALSVPPRCVDLDVDVASGPHLVTRFHMDEPAARPIVATPPVLGSTFLWARENFLEPASRSSLFEGFWGASLDRSPDSELVDRRLLESLTFREADAVDDAEIELSVERVRAYLGSRGYPAPEVSIERATYDDGNVAIDLYLRPGRPAFVQKVRFLGNRTIPVERILDDVTLAARERSALASGAVSVMDLQEDTVRLRSFYETQGFREADVRFTATMSSGGKIDVTFIIEEGERFVVGDIILVGGDAALTPQVLAAMSHCAGDGTIRKGPPKVPADCRGTPLRPDEFEADAQRVAAVYSSFGFPHVDATVELGFGERGPILRVSVFPVDDGPEGRREPTPGNVRPLRIGEIFLEGNLLTERNVLLREMGLGDVRPGDRLDPTKIEAGVGRLRRTGLYSRVDLDYIGIADGDDRAHLRIAVEERPSTTVDLSAGFSTQQLLSIRLEGRNRNLFGTMFDGSVGVDFGLFIGRFSQVRSQIRWPRMLGSNVSLSLTPVALSYRDDPAGVFLFTPSTLAGQKAAAAWERPDTRRRLFTLGSSLSLDWRAEGLHPKIDNKLTIGAAVEARGDWLDLAGTPFAPFSRDALATVDGLLELLQNHDPSQVVAFTPRVAWSDIDNPFDPKEGLGAEFFYRGVPFALVPYGVLGAQTRGYWTFGDRLTLATGVRLRWGMAAGVPNRCLASDPQSCAWALMQNDLLRPGGERTVRAVQEGGIGVHGVQYDSQLVPVFQAGQPLVGVRPGLFGAVANVELRYSLIRQFFLGELKPAVFADLGVSTDDLSFELGDALTDPRYALSVGAGLRYVLPVGPLSFDVAWSPLARTGTGAPFQVHVVLGYIF